MTKLRQPISFETTFGVYSVDELLGQGGAGRVYGGLDPSGVAIAIKLLNEDTASTDKRGRFKNEIAFLQRNKHRHIVTVTDHGIARSGEIVGPFYVMRRYSGNLRDLMRNGISASSVLPMLGQVLDGVEAAHLQNVVHRDLKPENILFDKESNTLAIADFGTARFTEDMVATTVETRPAQRLANFQYAAPEQRTPGGQVLATADIYALGLIMNELFTGMVPLGTEYRLINQVAPELSFLDGIVAKMLRQSPEERPNSIVDVKRLIQQYQSEAVSLQRLSAIDGTVIKSDKIDEPLAETPPKLIDADWDRGTLTLTLDRPVTPEWIEALQRMTSFTSVLGKPPSVFSFRGTQALVNAAEHEVQMVVDNFKTWLPLASRSLKDGLERTAQRDEAARRDLLRREREAEEQRLRVRRNIRI